jgi:hypothetical protein
MIHRAWLTAILVGGCVESAGPILETDPIVDRNSGPATSDGATPDASVRRSAATNDAAHSDASVTELADQRAGPRTPKRHLPNGPACDRSRGAVDFRGDGGLSRPLSCSSDADCSGGVNGRCTPATVGGGAVAALCTYDACFNDGDCPNGTACSCRGRDFHRSWPSDENRCMSGGNCHVDGDCGSEYCSPSKDPGCANLDFVGLFCHTTDDECVDDQDCPPGDGFHVCAYDSVVRHWRCVATYCAES